MASPSLELLKIQIGLSSLLSLTFLSWRGLTRTSPEVPSYHYSSMIVFYIVKYLKDLLVAILCTQNDLQSVNRIFL